MLQVNKGTTTMVTITDDYNKKFQEHLVDPAYQPILSDPTTYIEKWKKINSSDSGSRQKFCE